MSGPEHDARLKKLSFRAWRRGFREADLILGPFADRHAAELDARQAQPAIKSAASGCEFGDRHSFSEYGDRSP